MSLENNATKNYIPNISNTIKKITNNFSKDNEDCVMHSWWGQQQTRVHSRDVRTFIDNLWIQHPTRKTCECRFAQKFRGDKMTAQERSDGLLERELELLLKSFMRCSASRHQRELHLRLLASMNIEKQAQFVGCKEWWRISATYPCTCKACRGPAIEGCFGRLALQ